MRLFVDIDQLDVIEGIGGGIVEYVEFVKKIDEYIGDYEFTERLYQYFAKAHKEFLEEKKGLVLDMVGNDVKCPIDGCMGNVGNCADECDYYEGDIDGKLYCSVRCPKHG